MIKRVAGHFSAYEVAEEGQRVVLYSKHPPQLSRYYHASEEAFGLLFDALARGTIPHLTIPPGHKTNGIRFTSSAREDVCHWELAIDGK